MNGEGLGTLRVATTRPDDLADAATRYAELAALLRGETLPAGLIDLDAFDHNLDALAARAGGMPIRVASKSIRVPALLRRALAHPAYRGLLCYSVAEAVRLAELGFDDLLVAYPTLQTAALTELAEATARGRRIVAMVDHESHLVALARAAEPLGVRLPVAFDIDLSLDLPGLRFGVYRSPLDSPERAVALYRALARYPALDLVAVMGYEAQIAGVGDAVPGQGAQNLAVRALKQWAMPRVAARRQAIVQALREAGATLALVNGGGTGSLESTRLDSSVTELAAGSGLMAPRLFDFYRTFRHRPAAFFALETCRNPGHGRITCQGGGWVASGATDLHKSPQPVWPQGLRPEANEGVGEVQTPLSGPTLPRLGEAVLWRPAKAGEWLDHLDEVLLIGGRRIQDRVPTYRGMGWRFF
ncbi:alanine racemase [Chitinimonas lacunae]|uniref:Alanine racemase n=1 Tax=Chitinimonas lacunae TaxID=1963018 RepID=A0ABV8MS91_9NEIS